MFDITKERKEQRDWYNQQLRMLGPRLQKKARQGYEQAWQEAHDAEPVEHKKSNAARRAANTRLRLFVERVIMRGYRQG
jgi:hypothetical protein